MSVGFEIAGRRIGPGQRAYIVAEMSANHGGSVEHAARLIRRAADCGADAVKLQTYTPDTLTIDCDRSFFRIGSDSLWADRTLYDLYREAYTPWEWHPKLKAVADEAGITLFSTPFDASAVDFLEELGMPAFKIASFELVDLPLLKRVAKTGKPIILSTGMGTLAEIEEAVDAIRGEGNDRLVLLKCTSAYPAPPEEMHLKTLPHLAEAFGLPVGLSDHTMGTAVAVASVALGACVVEKHFCLSRDEGGPDSSFSLEPADLRQLVHDVRVAEAGLGDVHYGRTEKERSNLVFRRSLFVVEDIKAGEPFTARNVRVIRPGYGLPPKYLDDVLGRRATVDVRRGTPLSWDLTGGRP